MRLKALPQHRGHPLFVTGAADGAALGGGGLRGVGGGGVGVRALKAFGVEAAAKGAGTAELKCKGHEKPSFPFLFSQYFTEKV